MIILVLRRNGLQFIVVPRHFVCSDKLGNRFCCKLMIRIANYLIMSVSLDYFISDTSASGVVKLNGWYEKLCLKNVFLVKKCEAFLMKSSFITIKTDIIVVGGGMSLNFFYPFSPIFVAKKDTLNYLLF